MVRYLQPAAGPLKGEMTVPGDKSVSHRSIMLGSLAEGTTRIRHFLKGEDCLRTIDCFRKMGISIREENGEVFVEGKGLDGLNPPGEDLYVGNSGTTMRLMAGILAGQTFESVLDGDASIRQRPMKRVITPLTDMHAKIRSLDRQDYAPLAISPSALRGIRYASPVASAQVKSCILLAGLYADSAVTVTEPALSRDHTERMLRAFGAEVETGQNAVAVKPRPVLRGTDIEIPGDISSAAYFIAAASIVPGSEILLRGTGINPTRDGILRIAGRMGADITFHNRRETGGEPVADILVRYSSLKGVDISGDIIPALIDELPVIAVMAAFAQGRTRIADAAELKVKESDRIAVMTENLRKMGVDVVPTEDGMIIEGGKPLKGAVIDTRLDHRVAMSFAVASLAAEGKTGLNGAECVNISYPGFYETLSGLAGR